MCRINHGVDCSRSVFYLENALILYTMIWSLLEELKIAQSVYLGGSLLVKPVVIVKYLVAVFVRDGIISVADYNSTRVGVVVVVRYFFAIG